VSGEHIELIFPNLTKDDYQITSPESPEYNCIAWAAGDTEVWWWPDSQYQYYWPPEVPRTESLESFIEAYNALGYVPCDNEKYEEGFEKVAIFVGQDGRPTHAARQLNNGRWTSKLGQIEDIEHITLDGLVGSRYGSVV